MRRLFRRSAPRREAPWRLVKLRSLPFRSAPSSCASAQIGPLQLRMLAGGPHRAGRHGSDPRQLSWQAAAIAALSAVGSSAPPPPPLTGADDSEQHPASKSERIIDLSGTIVGLLQWLCCTDRKLRLSIGSRRPPLFLHRRPDSREVLQRWLASVLALRGVFDHCCVGQGPSVVSVPWVRLMPNPRFRQAHQIHNGNPVCGCFRSTKRGTEDGCMSPPLSSDGLKFPWQWLFGNAPPLRGCSETRSGRRGRRDACLTTIP